MSNKNKKQPQKSLFTKLSLICLSVLACAWLVVWIIIIAKNITFPQVDYSEGFNMWNAHLFGSGLWRWDALQGPPFNALFYPPVWFALMGKVTNIFGDSLIVGRVANILTTAVCMMLIFLIVQYLTKSRVYGFLGALFPLMSSTMVVWSVFPRVDMLAIAFELAGIYILLRFESRRIAWLSIPLFILAIYTKQSIFAGAAAACAYLILKDWRKGLFYSGALALSVGVIFLVANMFTHGDFYRQVITFQQVPQFNTSVNIVNEFIKLGVMILPILVLGVVYCLRTSLRSARSLPAFFVVFALVINTASLFHVGGNTNYYFESIFALSLAAGVCLKEVVENRREFFIYLFALSVYGLIAIMPNLSIGDSAYAIRYREAVGLIQDANYPILTENAQLVLDAGKEPYYEPFVYSNMAKLGKFNENIVLNDLESNKIEYVITQYKLPYFDSTRFDRSVQQAILDNYHVVMDAPTPDPSKPDVFSFVLYEANRR